MPNHKERRTIFWTYEQQIKAANAIPSREVCAATVRLVLNQMGLLMEQRGNQSIGDTLGRHGLNLPSYKKNGKAHYTKPAPGASITRTMVEESFNVPHGYAWDRDNTAEFAAAAAAIAVISAMPAKLVPIATPALIVEIAEAAPIEPATEDAEAAPGPAPASPAPVAPIPEIAAVPEDAEEVEYVENTEDRPPSAIWLAGQEHTRLNHLSCRLAAAAERAEKRAAEAPGDADLAARARKKLEEAKEAALPPTPGRTPGLPTPIVVPDQGIKEGEWIEPSNALLDSLAVPNKWADRNPVIRTGARAAQLSDEVANAERAAQRALAKAKDHPDDALLGELALRAQDALVAARIQSQAAWTEYHRVYAEYKAAWREGDPPLLREHPPEAAPPPDPVQLARE